VTLVLHGGRPSGDDQRVLDVFAAQIAAAAERERLVAAAGRASELAATNSLRASLLQAVSHDLRTPLASIKASISSLRQDDVDWPADAVAEFSATIEEEVDRLSELVDQLLDMSRLQADAVHVDLRSVGVDEAVLSAVSGLGAAGRAVCVEVSPELTVRADAALLERALANLVSNAVRFSPAGAPVRVGAGAFPRGDGVVVDVRIVDRGPGIDRRDRDQVFEPFQRLGDQQAGTGLGLGLAIARGFVVAMGGTLAVEDTPGGGTTMVVTLPSGDAT
jgi:two-component system sensor histidine kinase KdpD